MRVFYLDTSAVMKFLQEEDHTAALGDWKDTLESADRIVSSDILRTELLLGASRLNVPLLDVGALLSSMSLLTVTAGLCEAAGRLSGLRLRSLDALHIASAMSLTSSLHALVSYDTRMLYAAKQLGIPTLAPT